MPKQPTTTNFDDLKRLRDEAMRYAPGSAAWIKAAQALMDAFPKLYETAKGMNGDLDLLRFVMRQDRLVLEHWHHPGGVQSYSVFTSLDDESQPSGRADTARKALQMAMDHQDKLFDGAADGGV